MFIFLSVNPHVTLVWLPSRGQPLVWFCLSLDVELRALQHLPPKQTSSVKHWASEIVIKISRGTEKNKFTSHTAEQSQQFNNSSFDIFVFIWSFLFNDQTWGFRSLLSCLLHLWHCIKQPSSVLKFVNNALQNKKPYNYWHPPFL